MTSSEHQSPVSGNLPFSLKMAVFSARERGNIFAMLFAAVALTGVLASVGMQTLTGPVTTITRVTQKNVAENNLLMDTKILVNAAVTGVNGGDPDNDGIIEPASFVAAGGGETPPVNGGFLPTTLGLALTDPWGSKYGYCVWDHGTTNSSTGRIGGDNTVAASTQPVIAVIAAGPDKVFQTTCAAYTSGPVTVTKAGGSDDLIFKYTYAEATASSNGLWSLNTSNQAKAELKNSAGNAANVTIDRDTGVGDFLGIITSSIAAKISEIIDITGALKLDTAGITVDTCNAGAKGALRLNAAETALEMCDGVNAWLPVKTPPGGSAGHVQFNDGAGALGGDANLFWDNTNKRLGIGTNGPALPLDVIGDIRSSTVMRATTGMDSSGYVITPVSGLNTGSAGVKLIDTGTIAWSSTTGLAGAADVGLARNAAGVLKVTNGAAGGGSIHAGGAANNYFAGNVGIGTATPAEKLTVSGNASISGTLGVTGAATLGSTLAVTGASTLSSTLAVTGAATLSSTLAVTGNTTIDTNTLFVDATLNSVGIGTVTPAARLDVVGGVKFGADATCNVGKAGMVAWNTSILQLCDGTGWKNLMTVAKLDDIGDVDASTPSNNEVIAWDTASSTWKAKNINVLGPAVAAPGGADKQVQFNDGGTLAGAAQLNWDKTNSRLGIGTATPAYQLDVAGAGVIGIGFTDTAAPYTNYVLKSSAANNAGMEISLGAGGNLFLGGGESSATMDAALGNGEGLYLGSDNAGTTQAIKFITGMQTSGWASRVEAMTILGNGSVGIGTATPNASALLDVTSTTQGFLPPRMTTVQRDAIATPANGLLLYNSTTGRYNAYQGGSWQEILTSATGNIVDDSLDFNKFVDNMTLDASTDIAATGTNVLSITNSGTGDSLVVKDQAGDTTPFVVDASGYVGVGVAVPDEELHVSGTDTDTRILVENTTSTAGRFPGVDVMNYMNGFNNGRPSLIYTNHRGTRAAPLPLQATDDMGTIATSSYDGSGGYGWTGYMSFTASETHSTTAGGTEFYVRLAPNGSRSVIQRFKIAQDGSVAISNSPPNASAVLDVVSTTKGFLPPRMTTVQRDAIATPANGLLLYNSTTGRYNAYQGGSWQEILTSATGNIVDDSLNFDKFVDNMTLDANTDIATGAFNLTVTNDGTGDTLRVNDNGTADTTPFVVNGAGNVGIGEGTPATSLHIKHSASGQPLTNVTGLLVENNGSSIGTDILRLNTSLGVVFSVANSGDVNIGSNGINSGLSIGYNVSPPDNGMVSKGAVGIGVSAPAASAVLDVSSTTGGLLPPRMTTVQRDAIATPANGLLLYNSTTGRYNAYQGGSWQEILTSATGNIVDDSLNFDKFVDNMTLDANTDIATGAFNLTVTNDGTGNTFRVNDNGTGDTSPFIVDATGNVGVGTASPTERLDFGSCGGASPCNLKFGSWSYLGTGSAGYPFLSFGVNWTGTQWNSTHATVSGMIMHHNASYTKFSTAPANTTNATLTDRLVINNSTGAVGVGTGTPNASALLDLSSTALGFLPPRMTTVQRDAIATPANGLLLYNSTTGRYNAYQGGSWQEILTSATGNIVDDSLNFDKFVDNMTLDANTDIATGAFNLTVTNDGTGNTFRVNDNGTADATPFVVDASGYVGVGTAAPGSNLHVATSGAAVNRGLLVSQHNDGIQASILTMMKSRGTQAVPTIVNNGDYIGALYFQGYAGGTANSGYPRTASIISKVDGAPSATGAGSVPTALIFSAGTADDTSILNEGMRIASTGNVGIGNTNPTTNLDVEIDGTGSIRLTDSTAAGGSVSIGEGSSAANSFMPVFQGVPVGNTLFTGVYSTVAVAEDSGTVPAMKFTSRLVGSTAVAVRPIFQWSNNATTTMTMSADGRLAIGAATADASALLDVQSTSKGFLPPRMTTVQRDAIATPANGLILYNSTSGRFNAYQGGSWQEILTSATGNIVDDSLNFDKFVDAMSLDASTDIAVTGTNVLSITNSGTGDSFRVNDAAGDTSPFEIDDAGNVSVGMVTPDTTVKLAVTGSNMGWDGSATIRRYENLAFYSASGAVTGTMKFTLPKTWSNTMQRIVIKGYNYTNNTGAWEVVVGGYNFTGPGWYNHSAEIRGKAPFTEVRLAHDGTKNVILLGNTSTAWTYPKIAVTEMLASHVAPDGWGNGWAIAPITDETGIANIVTPTVQTASSSGTQGYIQLSNGSGGFTSDSAANNQFYWDMTNHRLGLGTATPFADARMTVLGTGTGNYNAMTLTSSVADATNKGGIITGARTTNANVPFAGFATWDAGTSRSLYFGGGAWNRPDATMLRFFTATAYDETNGAAGNERMRLTGTGLALAPSGTVGNPAASAALDITSTTQGFLPPRMTTVQRDAIASPTNGLLVYNSTTNRYNAYQGGTWIEILTSAVGNIADDSLNFDKFVDNMTLDASTDIATGAFNLTVTNDGAGNTLRVNDNGSGDTSPFVIDATGEVGVGTATPGAPIDVVSTGNTIIAARSYSGASNLTPHFIGFKARGTEASPTYPLANDGLATFQGRSGVSPAAWPGMTIHASENQTAVAQGAYISFGTVATGTVTTSERMRIDQNGNVGISASAPQSLLHVGAGTDAPGQASTALYVSNAGAANLSIRDSTGDAELFGYASNALGGLLGTFTSHKLTFRTANADRMAIDTSGNVGIGTTTPSFSLDVSKADADTTLRVVNTSSTAARYPQVRIQNFTGGLGGHPTVEQMAARGTSAVPTAVQASDVLMSLAGWGYNGTGYDDGARIYGIAEGTFSATSAPTSLTFNTTATGSTVLTERMRVTGAGNVGIGTASPAASALLDITSTTQGFLPPRMTTAQRTAIATPATGLLVYDTTLNQLYMRTSSAWSAVGSGSGSAAGSTGQVQFNNGGAFGASANFFWDNANSRLGIGNGAPAHPLHVSTTVANPGGIISLFKTTLDDNTAFQIQNSQSAWQFSARTSGDALNPGGFNFYRSPDGTNSWVAAMGLTTDGRAAVGAGGPVASAAFEVVSTSKGFLPPRLTTAQVTAIGTPPDGLMAYDSDTDTIKLRANGAWVSLQNAGTPGTAAGTVAGAVQFRGSTGVFAADDTNLVWDDTNNRLGITIASPTAKLDVADAGSAAGARLINIGDDTFLTDVDVTNVLGLYGSGNSAVGGLKFGSAGPTLMSSGGNLGIGTTTPTSLFEVSAADANTAISVYNTSSTAARNPRINVINFGGTFAGTPVLQFANVGGTSAAPTSTPTGWVLGGVDFGGYAGSAYVDGAVIRSTTTEAWGATAAGTNLSFGTTPNGTTSYVERMLIDQSGFVRIGGTGAPAAMLQVKSGAIMPAVGNTTTSGVYFPPDPGGGAGDSAWIRYYVESAENTKLQIGTDNDADDDISFYQQGAERMVVANSGVAIGVASPDNSALLDVSSTTRGFLPPRMTTAQVTAIAAPVDGLMAYDSTTDTIKLRANGAWVSLAAVGSAVSPDSLDFTEFKDAMALDANTDIAATGTNELSITNSGTGDSLVVNDQAGDASPFVIDASGIVGIGITAPSAQSALNVQKTYSTAVAGEQYGILNNTTYAVADSDHKQGIRSNITAAHTTGTINLLRSYLGLARNTSTGTVTDATAYWGRVDNTGGGSITSAYGLQIDTATVSGGSIGTQYGVYVNNLTTAANNFSIYTGTAKSYFGGDVGIGTGVTAPAANLTVGEAPNATQTALTQGLGNAGMLITTTYVANNYTPGLFWNTSDNNATKPKAGIYLQETATGTIMMLGTSSNYATGITSNVQVSPTGIVTATSYYHSSDARLKDKIETFKGGLEIIRKLRGVSYVWKNTGKEALGLIAQEVEQILPMAVTQDANGMRAVDYDMMVAPLIEAVKELDASVTTLVAENAALKNTVKGLEQKVENLEARLKAIEEKLGGQTLH